MFDIVFAQLGVIPRTRNKFIEIVAVAERHFIIGHLKKKESKKQPIRFPAKLPDGRMSVKKGKNLFVPKLQYCQFGQDGYKNRTF